MKWKNLQMPKNVELEEKTSTVRYGKFSIEPLLSFGYGDRRKREVSLWLNLIRR